MNKILAKTYQHIDNGGITLEIGLDDDNNVYIETGSSYFGYPSIGSRLVGAVGSVDSRLLTEFAKTFADAAAKLKNHEGNSED